MFMNNTSLDKGTPTQPNFRSSSIKKSYGGVRMHRNKSRTQQMQNTLFQKYNQLQSQTMQKNPSVVYSNKYNQRYSKKKHETPLEKLSNNSKEYVKLFKSNIIHSGAPDTNYKRYLVAVCDYLVKTKNLNHTPYLKTTQKYLNFFSSEILFRGDSLLYLVYLEIFPYLDGTNLSYLENKKYKYSGGSKINNQKGGNVNLNGLMNAENIVLIYAMKLLYELHHDFKGHGKTLTDMKEIVSLYELNIAKIIELNPTFFESESSENSFFQNLSKGHGEWHFFKCTLDYLIDKGMFDDLSMFKYRSYTNTQHVKDYFIIDMDGKEATPLFEKSDFKFRFPDNSTCDSALSKLLRDTTPDWKPEIIQNAPSLTDPATTGVIDVSKFYPNPNGDVTLFLFQKCQDLNNYFDGSNKIIVKIMCNGIDAFFKLFGGRYAHSYYEWAAGFPQPLTNVTQYTQYKSLYFSAPIRFIILDGDKLRITSDGKLQEYFHYLYTLNNSQPLPGVPPPLPKQFYYSGISIRSFHENEFRYFDLQVGDTTIKNIASLVNSTYVDAFSKSRIIPPTDNESWIRLCSLASFIKSTITDTYTRFQGKTDAQILKFLIVCLKALGDWYQVFYVSSIHYSCFDSHPEYNADFARQFGEIVKYLSSSDKNTIADMMIHSVSKNPNEALRFLGNGFCVKPSENLYARFPGFFDNLTIPTIPQNGYGAEFGTSIEQTTNEDQRRPVGKDNDENDEVDDAAGIGSLKGMSINFKIKDENVKRKVAELLLEPIVFRNLLTVQNDNDVVMFDDIVKELGKTSGLTDHQFYELLLLTPDVDYLTGILETDDAYDDADTLQTLKQYLPKILLTYNKLKEGFHALETEINLLIELSEKEHKSIFKLSETKRDLTSDEIAKLDKVYSSPVYATLQPILENKINKLLGIGAGAVAVLTDKVKFASDKITKSVKKSREIMSKYLKTMKTRIGQSNSSSREKRVKKENPLGIVEFVGKHDSNFTEVTNGGRRRARRTLKKKSNKTIKKIKMKY